VLTKPPVVEDPDGRHLARHIRRTGAVVLIACLVTAGWIAWREWRRTEPTVEELLPGTAAAASRQMGLLYGPFVRDLWEVWRGLRRPYPLATIIATSGVIVMLGCSRLATRHDDESES